MITAATYSPDDNKLRLYPDSRLDEETYKRVRAAGFIWAPKQELFVCPAWNPQAEDLATELAGEIGDEDTSLVERAEERAERFEDYSKGRERDGDQAQAAVSAIADNIPIGQPILVGHHSERHARRDAKKIERGMRRALKMFEMATYWEQRAKGAIRAARYKEQPEVRARRIKGLETDRRRYVYAYTPQGPAFLQEPYNHKCVECGNSLYGYKACVGHEFVRDPDPEPTLHVFVGPKGRGSHPVQVSSLPAIEEHSARWIEHIDKRLVYERAMLKSEDASHLLEKRKKPAPPALLNYRAGALQTENMYHRGEVITYNQVEVTKAQLAKVYKDYKGTRLSLDHSHRFRIAHKRLLGIEGDSWEWVAVFLTDSKAHEKPTAAEVEAA